MMGPVIPEWCIFKDLSQSLSIRRFLLEDTAMLKTSCFEESVGDIPPLRR